MKVLASYAAPSSNVGLAAGVGGEMLAIYLERVPRQLQAQLPGYIIGEGLQEVGPGAEQLKPGEGALTAYRRKWFYVAEALVGDEAAGVSASWPADWRASSP